MSGRSLSVSFFLVHGCCPTLPELPIKPPVCSRIMSSSRERDHETIVSVDDLCARAAAARQASLIGQWIESRGVIMEPTSASAFAGDQVALTFSNAAPIDARQLRISWLASAEGRADLNKSYAEAAVIMACTTVVRSSSSWKTEASKCSPKPVASCSKTEHPMSSVLCASKYTWASALTCSS